MASEDEDMKVFHYDTVAMVVAAFIVGGVLCATGSIDVGGTLIGTAAAFAFTNPIVRRDR